MQEKEAFDIVWNACEGLSRKAFTKLTKELCKVIAPGVEFVRIEEKRAIFRSKAVDLLTVESVFSKVFKEYSFNCCEKLPKLAEAAGFLIETLPNKKSVHKDDFFNPSQSEAACLAVLFYDLIYAICHVKDYGSYWDENWQCDRQFCYIEACKSWVLDKYAKPYANARVNYLEIYPLKQYPIWWTTANEI